MTLCNPNNPAIVQNLWDRGHSAAIYAMLQGVGVVVDQEYVKLVGNSISTAKITLSNPTEIQQYESIMLDLHRKNRSHVIKALVKGEVIEIDNRFYQLVEKSMLEFVPCFH